MFFFFLCLYLLGGHGFLENPDAEVTYLTARGIALHGDPAITPELGPIAQVVLDHEQGIGSSRTTGYACAPGLDGRYYAWFGIGHALWKLPFYIAGKGLSFLFPGVEETYAKGPHPLSRMAPGLQGEEFFSHLLVSLSYPLAGALVCQVLFGFALILGLRRSTALILTMVYGLATMAWPFARESLSDGPATLMALLFFRSLVAWQRGHSGDSALFMAAIHAGAMVAIRPMLGLILLPSSLWLLWFIWSSRKRIVARLVYFSLPLLLCAAGLIAYNCWRFGHPTKFGYHEQYSIGFWSFPVHIGVVLQIFSPGKGLLPFNLPLLGLLALIGATRKPGKPEVLLFIFPPLMVLLPVAFTSGWHGGQCWGLRYLLPTIPLLILLTGYGWEGWQERKIWAKTTLVVPVILGMILALGGVLSPVHGWFQVAFPACTIEYPGLVPHIENGVYTLPKYSPLSGGWTFLAANVKGELAAGELPVDLAKSWFGCDQALPLDRQSTGFRHFWFVGIADRFGVWWVFLLAAGLVVGMVVSLVRLFCPKRVVMESRDSS